MALVPESPVFSVVVPFFNEADNLPLLIAEIDKALSAIGLPGEIILVNDGSTDSYAKPERSPNYPVRWLDITARSGQSAAMYFGTQAALGEFVGYLDADLQNDPADLGKLLALVQAGSADLVTGIRTRRNDDWVRRFTSRFANAVRSRVLGDHTSDTGCSLKVLRAEAAKRLPAWNGMHRFIPALIHSMGYRTGETPVNHRARHAGVSKVLQGKRALRATIDLLGMVWLGQRQFKGRLAK
ncbi:Glycosyltransferase involved in cell wall bisynthesis [Verrucomicrobium sp. GAS474]|uniref:glycosyltransferase family 2 protein n=1 Tax=Verrucomicrobium sp. GAS474 TaxID=1882831 RepID=UPI00087C0E38|nr:glycosyltransferase family 2 protein [Verrucomicrobium sp. GAS474]SDU16726.1 Glycosyltransferase involved in cell wall bisynthesis [Verrucomicrobium sp. GAS474]